MEMVLFEGRRLIKIGLSCTWLLLIAVSMVHAAILKDVRLGDHNAFTRIVLEFDSNVPSPAENKDNKGLFLTFASSRAGLIRKIPNIASSRIEKLIFWENQNSLSIQIVFNFQKFRYEFLELSGPYRLVIDIFPRNSLAPDEALAPQKSTSKISALEVQDKSTGLSSSIDKFENTSLTESSLNQPNKNGTTPSIPQADKVLSELKTEGMAQDLSKPPRINTSSLQFYLVISLVVITIIILVLLVLMLLVRYRWAVDKSRFNINELLQNQEDNIASLNARIQEQLKRYDEA